MPGFIERVIKSWSILTNGQQDLAPENTISSYDSIQSRARRDTNAAVLAPIINRVSIDASMVPIKHVMTNEVGAYLSTRVSELNDRFQLAANIDQTGADFVQDAVRTMLTHGHCVIVPVEVTTNPTVSEAYDPLSLRVGVVTQWFNKSVRVELYNELSGYREEKTLAKSYVAICYNPMYSIMNEPNSTLGRLITKLSLLDISDVKATSPNLDLILQLPYAVRSELKEKEANARLRSLEDQLYKSAYGIAYVDATEKITQLNRPVANTLLEQVKILTDNLYNQLGLTEPVISGTASEVEMLSYNNRTVYPVLRSIVDACKVAFLTRTAIRQGQSLMIVPNLFKMASLETFASAADLLSRNEIVSSNEMRQVIGLAPVETKEANELRNKNLNKPVEDNGQNNGLNEEEKT